MAIRDNKSNNLVYTLYRTNLSSNSTGTSLSVDTASYDNGVTFFLIGVIFGGPTDTISIEKIEESDDNSTWNDVDSSLYIGPLSEVQNMSDSVFQNGNTPSLGVFGTKRFLRAVVSSGAANTGSTTIVVGMNLGVEVKPAIV